jgi:predicted Fe-Mo cluster-binding NifX family protein
MKLCIPTDDRNGLDAIVSDHVGRCAYLTLVDTASGELVAVIANNHGHEGHGTCNPLRLLEGHEIDALVCHGMGRRARANLEGAGLEVLCTKDRTVRLVMEAAERGALPPLQPGQECHGHGSTTAF